MTTITDNKARTGYPLGRRTRVTDELGIKYTRPSDDDLEQEVPAYVEGHPLTGRTRREAHR